MDTGMMLEFTAAGLFGSFTRFPFQEYTLNNVHPTKPGAKVIEKFDIHKKGRPFEGAALFSSVLYVPADVVFSVFKPYFGVTSVTEGFVL
jgi:hypothetical protein